MEGWYLYHPSRVVVFHEYTRAYRAHFKPSSLHPRPVPMMAISVLCAETDEEADLLSRSREVWAMRLRTLGNPGPVPSVEEALDAAKQPGADRWLWRDAESELLVHPARTRVRFAPGFVFVELAVFSDQTGNDRLVLPYKIGASPNEASLTAVSEARPRGDATLATRNVRDFEGLDLALVNPFEAGA